MVPTGSLALHQNWFSPSSGRFHKVMRGLANHWFCEILLTQKVVRTQLHSQSQYACLTSQHLNTESVTFCATRIMCYSLVKFKGVAYPTLPHELLSEPP